MTMTIKLREYLGVEWKQELISYPMFFDQGTLLDEAVVLQGSRGILPAQLSDVSFWPGTSFVQRANLWFIVDELPPFTEQTFTLHQATCPTTDLWIMQAKSVVEITTAHFGLRCPLGESVYTTPISVIDVPGPVLGMRLPDRSWFGGSRLYGQRKLIRRTAELIARGPVFAEVSFEYNYEDGLSIRLVAKLIAGDSHTHWRMAVEGDALEEGWQLNLTPGLSALVLDQVPWEFFKNTWGAEEFKTIDVPLDNFPVGILTNLIPWEDWWDDQTQTRWVIKTAGRGKTLEIASEDPGCWVKPASKGTLATWDGWLRKPISLCRDEEVGIYLRINAASDQRAWRVGAHFDSVTQPIPHFAVSAHQIVPGHRTVIGCLLDTVKDYVLDWPGDCGSHPHLYLSATELKEIQMRDPVDAQRISTLVENSKEESHGQPHVADADALGAYLLTGDPQIAAQTQIVERLRNHLALFGAFDTMRFVPHVVALYDALIDSPLVPDDERAMLRARMAYLGYVQASPARWSCERGYRSYNLNMSVSHTLHLGMIACTIPEHPLARTWVQPALDLVDDLLNEVGPAGEWPESVSNYVHVSGSALLLFAITALNAGFHDFVNDARMKRLQDYIARQYAPQDISPHVPGEPVLRALPPHGRAKAGHRFGLPGMMARATHKSDPSYSSVQQWVWKQIGENREIPNGSLGGFEQVYLDSSLPESLPSWETDQFPQAGVIFRQGLGTPQEFYANLISADFPHQVFSSETGAFSLICAKGTPLAGSFFGGYGEREELLTSRVCLARGVGSDEERRAHIGYTGTVTTSEEESTGRRVTKPAAKFGKKEGTSNISDFSVLPHQDYSAIDIALVQPQCCGWKLAERLPEWPPVFSGGKPPVHWRRQVLFIKDAGTAETSYLLIRDTVYGGQPTMWQMWTLSDGVDSPEVLAKVGLASAGQRILSTRPLEGDHFTARGQFGVDVDYYIAMPQDTPRHTLRWGTAYVPERAAWHPLSVLNDNYAEYRDLLHLQLPGDGAYFVAFYPRFPEEDAPSFSTLGDGTIIRTSGDFGIDYGFLSALPQMTEADGITFQGVAASVQQRSGGLTLSLGAPGKICHPTGYALAAESAAQMHVADRVTVTVASSDVPRQVIVTTPKSVGALTLTIAVGENTIAI